LKEIITTDKAPAAIGPYSQAVKTKSQETLFCSGQILINPVTGESFPEDIVAQTRQVMNKLNQVILAAGCAFRNIVKTTIYFSDLAVPSQVNEVYESFFDGDFPAWATVQAAALGVMVEIEAYAVR
jgi:2-iminobutanoate/2-iminopropanoate deaminase